MLPICLNHCYLPRKVPKKGLQLTHCWCEHDNNERLSSGCGDGQEIVDSMALYKNSMLSLLTSASIILGQQHALTRPPFKVFH